MQRTSRSLIKNGTRTFIAAGFAFAWLGHPGALADVALDRTFEQSGPWAIGYNSSLKGCVASATSDDATTVWIGFEGSEPDTPAYIAFTNPSWSSIEARKFYDLEIQASSSYRWRGYASGIERPHEKGLFVFGVKRRALQDFAQTSGLVLSINKEPLARTNISGLSDAIEKLTYCQEHRLFALKNQGTKTISSVAEAAKQPNPETEGGAVKQVDTEQPKQQQSEAVVHTNVDQHPAERERMATNLPPAREEVKAERAAPQLAALPAPVPAPAEQQPATDPAIKDDALVRAIKQELKRVGCYNGLIDNDWQAPPARASVQKFVQRTGIAISLVEPTNALLDAIKFRTERVCPGEPTVYPIRRNVRHATRKCPGGFDADGDCISRRKTMTRHEIDDEDRRRGRRRGRVDIN
jgi:hypothetical protein